jgi:hypothetical protein
MFSGTQAVVTTISRAECTGSFGAGRERGCFETGDEVENQRLVEHGHPPKSESRKEWADFPLIRTTG